MLLVLNSWGLSTDKNPIRVLQSEHFGIQVLPTNSTNVIDCQAYLSWEEQLSFPQERLKSVDLHDGEASYSRVMFSENIKFDLQRQIDYIEHEKSFSLRAEKGCPKARG